MILYIAEKASVGRALANALPGQQKRDREKYGDDFIRCDDNVTVAWAAGHILELYYPEDYDEKYKSWRLEDLPIVPVTWKLKVIDNPQAKKLAADLERLLKTEATEVVNVGDADREGQLLIDEILKFYGWNGPTKRLRINDMNPEAITKDLANMKDNSEYLGEYLAGLARSCSDWLFGINLTRYLSLYLEKAGYESGGVFSVGRVQTPVVALVVNRDAEIANFVSKSYFVLYARLKLANGNREIIGKWQPQEDSPVDEEKRLVDQAACEALLDKLEGAEGTITRSDKKVINIAPPLLWSLPKLQAAMARLYDITNTQQLAQTLYEQGYITYPRTDCPYAPEGHLAEAEKVLDAITLGCPAIAEMRKYMDLSRKTKSWDDSKVTEHHAILPTTKVPAPGALSADERKLYDLIALRFALQFMPDCKIQNNVIEFEVAGEHFKATGKDVLELGWREFKLDDTEESNEQDEDEQQKLPTVAATETGIVAPFVKDQKTKPPQRFTYDTLLETMNSIHRFVKDPEIKKQLKELDGIGTAATQENILNLLFEREYLIKKKKQIFSTPKANLLIVVMSGGPTIVFVTPDLTAVWEQDMTRIARGELSFEDFMRGMCEKIREMTSKPLVIPESLDLPRRPKCLKEGCDGYLKMIKGKNGSFFKCFSCGAAFSMGKDGKPLPKKEQSGEVIEADCPLGCGRKARRFVGKFGPFWKCTCSPETTFKDVDGKPVVREQRQTAPCPVQGCKGVAVRFNGKNGLFWKCNSCQNFFDDADGKPRVRKPQGKTKTKV